MRRFLLIMSHLCSGSGALYDALDSNPRVQGFRGAQVYENALDLMTLTGREHKLGNAAAIYMDEVLHNYRMADRSLYSRGRHVFVVREPSGTLNEMVGVHGYSPESAHSYYAFRLRRLCEVARKSRDSVLLTYEDLLSGRGLDLVEGMLSLKSPLRLPESWADGPVVGLVGGQLLDRAADCYERHLYYLRRLGLRSPSQG